MWNTDNAVEDALNMTEGVLIADFDGIPVEQTISPRWVVEAASKFKEIGKTRVFYSQADIVAAAQSEGLCFQDWYSSLQSY